MPAPARVLLWSEAHGVGGHDRFVVDLLTGLDDDRFVLALAGNPDTALDAWLQARLPRFLPRITVPVATLPGSPLERLRQRIGARGIADTAVPGDGDGRALAIDEGPVARRAVVAALRYRHLATNVARLRRLLRRTRPDVLFVNNGGYPGGESCRAAVLAAHAEGVPRVVHFVHNMAYPPLWPAGLERRLDARIDAATTWWATGADRAAEALADARQFPRGRIATVHYGVPPAPRVAPAGDLPYAGDAFNVAVVAAFEPRKGHLVLLDAVAALKARGVRLRVACVGAGAARAEVASRIGALGLDRDVHLLGWRQDVPAVLAASDALVLPSLGNECLPYAILEAMTHGLPCVGTDVAGIPEEIEDGVTGWVVPPGDAAALADAMERLARDPAAARAMGAAGRGRATTQFDLPRMVRLTTDLWTR